MSKMASSSNPSRERLQDLEKIEASIALAMQSAGTHCS